MAYKPQAYIELTNAFNDEVFTINTAQIKETSNIKGPSGKDITKIDAVVASGDTLFLIPYQLFVKEKPAEIKQKIAAARKIF